MSLITNLLSYYKFDETSGSVFYDSHSSNDGTMSGATFQSTGKINYCISGAEYDVTKFGWITGSTFNFDRNDAFSLSFWFKKLNTASGGFIRKADGYTNTRGYRIGDYTSPQGIGVNFESDFDSENYFAVAFDVDFSVGVWYHIVMTYNGNYNADGVTLYFTGTSITGNITKNNLSGTIANINNPFNIAVANTMVDELAVWDRVLTQSEVNQLWNNGDGLDYDDFYITPESPSGVTVTNAAFSSIAISWINNSGGEYNKVEWYDGSWQSQVVNLTATTYVISGLSPATDYPIRVGLVETGTTYYSTTITGTTLTISAPTGLTVTDVNLYDVSLSWTNTSVSEGIHVYYKLSTSGTWQRFQTLSSGATTTSVTGLTEFKSYDFMVASYYSVYDYDSNIVSATTNNYPPPFCDDAENNYTIVDATCAAMDGEVIINNSDYLDLYEFFLGDSFGTSYTLYTDRFYVAAGWYALVAAPRQAYWEYIGRDICTISWIQVNNSGTTMTLDNKSVRNASCGTFGADGGRIVYFCTDTGGVGDYDIYVFDDGGNLVRQTNQTTIDEVVITGLPAGIYRAMILNNDGGNGGCTLLIDETQLTSLSTFAVAGIKRIFITEWNNLIEYNYWTAADESFYVSGLDSDFFSSIKIKEFVDSTLPTAWFEILMDTKGATFKQTMNKTKQGFVFTDTLELIIPHADNSKWKQLIDFLVNRYIVVFQDNNNQFWVMGYRLGAQVDGYRKSNNEYTLTLNAISDNKILTNIAESYVTNNIINS